MFKRANEALDPSITDPVRQGLMGLIYFTKHKRLNFQLKPWSPPCRKSAWHEYSRKCCGKLGMVIHHSFFGKRGRENHCTMKPGDIQLKTTTSGLKFFVLSEEATKNQSTFNVNPSSAPDFTRSGFHGCNFWYRNTFLFSRLSEQYAGKYEPKAPRFRVFHLRGVTRVNFT